MNYKISPDPSFPKRGRKWKSFLKRGKRKGRNDPRDYAKTYYFLMSFNTVDGGKDTLTPFWGGEGHTQRDD